MNIETITEHVLKIEPVSRAYIAETFPDGLDYEKDFMVLEVKQGAL